jgi:hemerythrin
MRLDWIPALSVGIDLVDQEHQHLLQLYNAVAALPEDEVNVPALLSELAAYAVTHFHDEEQYMLSVGNPSEFYLNHVEIHASFVRRLGELKGAPVYQILDYIQEWLFRHIMIEDRKIGTFVKALPQ